MSDNALLKIGRYADETLEAGLFFMSEPCLRWHRTGGRDICSYAGGLTMAWSRGRILRNMS